MKSARKFAIFIWKHAPLYFNEMLNKMKMREEKNIYAYFFAFKRE